MADLSDFNPAFSAKLDALKAALDKQGVGYTINSGYRSPEYQGRMYANHLAKQGGQPLPYPNDEAPAVVAPPWRSFHNYGLAADFALKNEADYPRLAALAPQFGLTGIGASDKGHIQLAGGLGDDINQYHLANWRPASQPAPAAGAVAYAGPSGARPVSTTPGTTLNSPLDIVLNAESGDRNVANTHATTSSGQAQGNAQITTDTWNDFAPKAGVDLKQYPTPMDAPRDVQIKVANLIPLNRWASSTVNSVLAKYPGIDTSKPLGEIQSAAINPAGASNSAAGGPAAPAATPTLGTTLGKLAEGLKPLAPGQGGQGGGAGQDEPPKIPIPQMPPAQASGGPMMMGYGGQNTMGQRLAEQALAQKGFLTQPSLAALTPGMPQQPMTPPGAATGIPGLPGTTLNSPSQLQMALMTGAMNPYDLYGSGGYGAGGFQGSA